MVSCLIIFFITPLARDKAPQAASWWHTNIPLAHFGKALLAFLVAVAFTHARNWFLDEAEQKRLVVLEEGDVLEQLLQMAFTKTKPLLLTLKSGKVYVCLMLDGFHPYLDRKYLSVVPVWSGYRIKDTQTIDFTTDYTQVYSHLTKVNPDALDDFALTIPTEQIVTATLFDRTIYDSHFIKQNPAASSGNS